MGAAILFPKYFRKQQCIRWSHKNQNDFGKMLFRRRSEDARSLPIQTRDRVRLPPTYSCSQAEGAEQDCEPESGPGRDQIRTLRGTFLAFSLQIKLPNQQKPTAGLPRQVRLVARSLVYTGRGGGAWVGGGKVTL